MNRLNILTFPDPRLRKKAVPVTTFDQDLEKKADDMLFTCLLYTSPSPRDKRQSRMPSSA